ncbi:hypothetical protein RQM59_04745 [Flavobacteriaceae bacterium S356]|uniref:DUF1579 domain-containing protein n=1 Tax=Asprobacillus argus TaxID=3076534 RepID=A0ABU3LDC6_9FLAO|nr:hypothetical protein [Flavobacteriaceae bacterium S356]
MKTFKNIVCCICFISTTMLLAQKTNATDKSYYKDWVGEWYKEVNDTLEKLPSFIVTQGLYKESFEEVWIGAGGSFSKAWRAWDGRTQQWGFAWISVDGLFQTWEGKKVNEIWYMYKTFVLDNGKKVLSRQAFIPSGKGVLIRTSEHSTDQGKTWTLRFKEKYVKRR